VEVEVISLLLAAIGLGAAAVGFLIKLYMKVHNLEREFNDIKNNPVLVKFKKAQDRYATEIVEEELSQDWPITKGALGSFH
jgi:hypothetical protein